MKKIAIISTSYYPNIWNSQGRSTFSTAYMLSSLGHDVTVFTFANTNTTYKAHDEGIVINYVGKLSPEYNASLPFELVGEWNERILAMLNKSNIPYDIIILNSWHGYEAAKRYGKAKVISFIPFLYNITGWLKTLDVAGLEEEIKQREVDCLLHSDTIVAHTEQFAKKVATYANRDVYVIPNCHVSSEKHLNLDWPEDEYVERVPTRICFVGRINREKNLERIIRVLPELPEVEFMIASTVSKLSHFKKLMTLAQSLDVEHRIKMLGWLPPKKVLELYKSSALAIIPSQFEPYGFSALDPMSLGTPVLVSEWSCLQEYLSDNNMVFNSMVQLQEKICYALGVPTDKLMQSTAKNKDRIATDLSAYLVAQSLDQLL